MKRAWPEGAVTVTYNDHGVTVFAAIPGYAGHVITRRTLADGLRVLADAIEAADARRPRAVGIA
jgi:hypothetical protein